MWFVIGCAMIFAGFFAFRHDPHGDDSPMGEPSSEPKASESDDASTGAVVLPIDTLADSQPVLARYIERSDEPAFEKAALWETEMSEMETAFYASHARTDRTARDEFNELMRTERIRRFDTDGDGEIDEFEADVMNRPRYERSIAGQKVLGRFDANRDMRIDTEEREALDAYYRSVVQENLDRLLPQYDANGDGRLNNEERGVYQMDVLMQTGESPEPERGRDSHRIEWLTNRLDMNGDARVNMEDTRLFLHLLARGSVIADLDRDGHVGMSDYDTHRNWSFELEGLLGQSP